jgi:hypothetical protein
VSGSLVLQFLLKEKAIFRSPAAASQTTARCAPSHREKPPAGSSDRTSQTQHDSQTSADSSMNTPRLSDLINQAKVAELVQRLPK